MLMGVALRKVWRDLWNNKGRTVLVVLSIAVGVMAVGMILSSNRIISRQLNVALETDHLPQVEMSLGGLVDDETIDILAQLPEVDEMEGHLQAAIRWKPSLDAEWQDGTLITAADFQDMAFAVITLQSGDWPIDDTIAAAFNHVAAYNVPPLGQPIFIRVNDRPRALTLTGTLRDPYRVAPPFGLNAAFFVSRDTFQNLIGYRNFNTLRFDVAGHSEQQAQIAADVVEARLKKLGVPVANVVTSAPDEHPFQQTLDGFGLVLVVMAIASLGLSTFLVINTINAIIAQQVPQIGIMKTIGGLRGQIANLYLAGVAIYGLLSLLLAVPLGALGGDILSRGLLATLNIPTTPFEVLPDSFVVQIAAGLLTPLLAALYPVVQGVGISVREAIAAYGLGKGRYGAGLTDRLLGRIKGLPRMFILMLRNTFRRMGRVALTELTLVAAGSIFMMITATSASFTNTLDEFWNGLGFDVIILFNDYQRIGEVVALMESRPNVAQAEMHLWTSGKARRPGDTGPGSEHTVELRGIPGDTEMYTPTILAGRNLLPDDGHAVLLGSVLAQELKVGVGDTIVLNVATSPETTWTVVGTTFDVSQAVAFVPRDVLLRDLGQTGRGTVAQITTTHGTEAEQAAVAKDLRDYFNSQGINVNLLLTKAENRRQNDAAFAIITNILQVMTVLMAVVGSLGLSGTLSINVLERRREIGVMRAVGASSLDVALIFMGEGLLLGVLSWVQAVPLSYVGGKFFVDALGGVFELPFLYQYPVGGAVTWLVIVTVLALVASWLPARRATQISVRESLAYE